MPFSAFIPKTDTIASATASAADSVAIATPRFIEMLKQDGGIDLMELVNYAAKGFIQFAANLIFALIVFVIGKWLLGRALRVVEFTCKSRHIDITVALFIKNLIQVVFYIILLLIVVQILGINTSSLVAMLASAGLAVGMALSGTLQNFAGGAMLLLLKPYRVGDYITTQGESGTVKEIMLFTTVLETFDRHTIFIPNSAVSSAVIDNATYSNTRRVDINVSISYGASVAETRAIIMDILKADKRILTGEEKSNDDRSYAPMVGVLALADSAVTIAVRAWVKTDDYWSVFFALNETIYETLPEHGIPFPFPQLDVHIKNEA